VVKKLQLEFVLSYVIVLLTLIMAIGLINVYYFRDLVLQKENRTKLSSVWILAPLSIGLHAFAHFIDPFTGGTNIFRILEASSLLLGIAAVGVLAKNTLTSYTFIGTKKRLESEVEKRTHELSASEEQWRKTFDSIQDLISIHDKDFRILQVNKAVSKALGVPREDLLGKHCYEVFHSRSTPWPNCPHKHTLETAESTVEDVVDPSLGGTFHISTFPIFEGGELIGSVHVCRDITGQKEMEEALREERDNAQRYLDIAGTMIVVIDDEQKVRLINKKGCNILGYYELEVIGKNWFDYFVPERLKEDEKTIFKKILAGEMEPVENYENPIVNKDGAERIIAWNNSVLKDEAGNITGTISSGEDVTERKAAEEELKMAYEELKVLEKMKDEFLSNISHELKTPLTSIKSAQELLMEEVEGEQKELIRITTRNIERLDALIGDILFYAELEQLPKELEKEELDFSRMIETAVKVMSTKAFDNEITIETVANGALRIHGDKKSLYKVLFNLMDNAIKFNKRGGIITLSGEKNGGQIRVTIKDSGIGIPKERQGKIFDRFYQMDGSTKRKHPGTGLGLSLAKAIVEKHGGWMGVESEVDKGSTFFFDLPITGKTHKKKLVKSQTH